jgi:hypothetical protein
MLPNDSSGSTVLETYTQPAKLRTQDFCIIKLGYM